MAACRSFLSMKTIRVFLEKNQIPFEVTPGAAASPSGNVVNRAADKAGPNIVAMVDSFSELPADLQDYLLSQGNLTNESPDRVKGVILGGKRRAATKK